MSIEPITFSGLYDMCFTVVEWVSNFVGVLRLPMKDWIEVDFGVDNVIFDIIEDAINYILDILLQSRFADWTILEFLFGSGLTTVLVLILVKFLLSIKK